MNILPGDYIAGFVDGEGCFALKFRRDVRHDRKNSPIYFYWDIEFAIMLRSDDKKILEDICETLNCGRISISKRGTARYAVNDLDDLLYKIVPFFERHQLRAKKRNDFNLWREALSILYKNKQLKPKDDDLKRLIEIIKQTKEIKSQRKDWKWLNMISQ